MLLHTKDGIRGKLIDLDTNQEIKKPIWVNTETGAFEAFVVGPDGKCVRNAEGNWKTIQGIGRLRFIPRLPQPTPSLPEPDSVIKERHEKLPVLLFNQECSKPGCGQLAEWKVSDEMELPPQLLDGKLYSRGRTIAIRHYCWKHYQAPRLVDGKGEVIKVVEDAHGVRPQWHST